MENQETIIENKTEIITLPTVALRGKTVFPKTFVNFDVGREFSRIAVEESQRNGGLIFITAQKTPDGLYKVGVVGRIRQIVKSNNSSLIKLSVEADYRAIAGSIVKGNCFESAVARWDYQVETGVEAEASFREAKKSFYEFTLFNKTVTKEIAGTLNGISDADGFIDNALTILPVPENKKQEILETPDTVSRLQLFSVLMLNELEISKAQKNIDAIVRKNVDANQKEYYLREQLKAIHQELGDDENEKEEYRKSVKDKHLDDYSEEKILKEIERLDRLNPSSPDYSVALNYLDWIKELPFGYSTPDNSDLSSARDVLNADHFGLEKVKERIVEFLAVLKLTNNEKGQILCFVGPPGVGKTSIAKSIARAMNRKFVRMSLGGVKDESEIRGHRRTYVGAMPGRIVYGLKQAGSMNPVFLLDEIDKMSADVQGDPASALLEVLDPEQNSTFRDRYIEIPTDLSKVLFITTANDRSSIPAPLLDRMEVIEISGYTELEKLEIASRYLVPKCIERNGLKGEQVEITKDALNVIVNDYTMEAGVRNLERQISSVVRKIATGYALNELSGKQTVDKDRVEELLGAKHKYEQLALEQNEVGACTGLAWTAFGGTTLTIEVGLMRGKGEILLTGKLGDVMKESARAGITYI
ncbi:MAG: endopeptidase La, partial [Clostridia bacterium]|nr:endopeptidase La [Clostridia bacterium]